MILHNVFIYSFGWVVEGGDEIQGQMACMRFSWGADLPNGHLWSVESFSFFFFFLFFPFMFLITIFCQISRVLFVMFLIRIIG